MREIFAESFFVVLRRFYGFKIRGSKSGFFNLVQNLPFKIIQRDIVPYFMREFMRYYDPGKMLDIGLVFLMQTVFFHYRLHVWIKTYESESGPVSAAFVRFKIETRRAVII